MVFFNGSIKLTVVEAEDLRPTDFATRHQVGLIGRTAVTVVDPYVSIDIDDTTIARTTTRAKTSKPTWNEDFTYEVHSGQNIGLTVFHDAAILPDEFVANCNIAFEDIYEKSTSDIWVCLGFASAIRHVNYCTGLRYCLPNAYAVKRTLNTCYVIH